MMILVTCCHSTNHTACYCGRDPNGKREFAYNLPKQEINTLDKWESFNTTLKCARIAFFFFFFLLSMLWVGKFDDKVEKMNHLQKYNLKTPQLWIFLKITRLSGTHTSIHSHKHTRIFPSCFFQTGDRV